jgi:hypothetical protein
MSVDWSFWTPFCSVPSPLGYCPVFGVHYKRYTSGVTPTDFRYTGQRFEDYIKLYWMGSRWYNSYLNRII